MNQKDCCVPDGRCFLAAWDVIKSVTVFNPFEVDAAYQNFRNTVKKATKKTIPRGYRNNYVPCWDAECKSFYRTFLQSPQGDNFSLSATALLTKLDRKRRDR